MYICTVWEKKPYSDWYHGFMGISPRNRVNSALLRARFWQLTLKMLSSRAAATFDPTWGARFSYRRMGFASRIVH